MKVIFYQGNKDEMVNSSGPVLSTAALRRLKKKKQKEREQTLISSSSLNQSQSIPGNPFIIIQVFYNPVF